VSSFNSQVDLETKEVLASLNKDVGALVEWAFSEFVKSTPVDTGTAKGNWLMAVDAKPQGEGTPDPSPVGTISGPALAKVKQVISGIKPNTTVIWIVNNSKYITTIVEEGHSSQTAPGTLSYILAKLQEKAI